MTAVHLLAVVGCARCCWRWCRRDGGAGPAAAVQPGRPHVVIFCGSKKSLATAADGDGAFRRSSGGADQRLLMIFHQIQPITCATLAGRWGRAAEAADARQAVAQVARRPYRSAGRPTHAPDTSVNLMCNSPRSRNVGS